MWRIFRSRSRSIVNFLCLIAIFIIVIVICQYNYVHNDIHGTIFLSSDGKVSTIHPNSPLTDFIDNDSLPDQQHIAKRSSSIRPKSDVNESKILESISKALPNLPLTYWDSVKKGSRQFNSTCAPLAKLFDVKFNNDNWQTLKTSNGTFQLLNAYFDNRTDNRFKPTVRILGMLDRIEPTMKTYCQLWFHNRTKPTIVEVYQYKYLWNKKWGNYKSGFYQVYLLGCQIPEYISAVPVVVSLVEHPCDLSSVSLKIIYNKPEKVKDFAVCVKGLNYPYSDKSLRLIEWMELLYILGADKIFFYNLDAHPNILKTLNYYEQQNKAQVTPLTLAGEQPNSHPLQYYFLNKKLTFKRQNEVIPYNDCFYKHMYEYRYIVLLDIDEVIIPVMNNTWKELMDVVETVAKATKIAEHASYNVQNVYFLDDLLHNHGWFDDIPKHMHMLQHVFRAKNFTSPGSYVKSFFNTNKTVGLHNHYPFTCLSYCMNYGIDKSYAQLQHYRSDCVQELKKTCDNYRNSSVQDTTIWKYKNELIKNVKIAVDQIGIKIEKDLT